jgi:hypothetical protein
MARAKKQKVKLLTTNKNKELVVNTIEHAEKILMSKNNAKGLIVLNDDNFELTKNGLRKKSVKGDN